MSTSDSLLIASQSDLHHKLSRVIANLKKRGVANITAGIVQAVLEETNEKWKTYKANHETLQQLSHQPEIMSSDYFVKDHFSATESIFVGQKGMLLDLLQRYQIEQQSAHSASPIKESTQVLSCPHENSKRVSLPRIPLPTFNGRFQDWQSFRDLFTSLVIKDTSISEVVKLHYLKSSVSDEAELLIRNLSITEKHFQTAWKILTDRYDNTRLLLQTQLARLFSIAPMVKELASELKRLLFSTNDICGVLEGLTADGTADSYLLVYLTVERLDKWTRREWESHISEKTEPIKFPKLKEFLDQRIIALEAIEQSSPAASSKSSRAKPQQVNHASSRSTADSTCSLCQKPHFLLYCNIYRKQNAEERKTTVASLQLCLNCLGHHSLEDCKSDKRCQVCEGKHHSSLHNALVSPAPPAASVSHASFGSNHSVLLATALVVARNSENETSLVRALIDTGSEVSLITEALVQRLLLRRKKTPLAILGVGSRQSVTSRGLVSLLISPYFNHSLSYQVNALILPHITSYKSALLAKLPLGEKLVGTIWADPSRSSNRPIDLLLGADIHSYLIREGVRKFNDQALVAQETGLGWILSGVIDSDSCQNVETISSNCVSLNVSLDRELHHLLERFWEIEEVEVEKLQSTDELKCEQHYLTTHSRAEDGRYVVRLPFRESPRLGSLFGPAQSMLLHLERRFRNHPDLASAYRSFMEEYLSLGHMSPLTDPPPKEHFYLPHHGVIRESSTTTKLRVVFNGSQTTSTGVSLNEVLHPGPNLLPELSDLILRWRLHRYVITADIEKMYRQILVDPSDREYQLILWRSQGSQHVSTFRLNTVTYGLVCAPFLAIRTLQQLANDEESRFPIGADVLRRDVYMDDVLTGASSVSELKTLQTQLDRLCRAGGFVLRKWCSNVPELLPTDSEFDNKLFCDGTNEHLVLGIQWNTILDCFTFQLRERDSNSRLTKRTVLSEVARILDPLGWIAPATVRAKIFVQSLWLLKIEWDATLPTKEAALWNDFRSELADLKKIKIPRWLGCDNSSESVELHGFCDASERAYAAALYIVVRSVQSPTIVRLLAAKTKVAPLKRVSLPRLELTGAYLLVRLSKRIQSCLQLDEKSVHLWSDSRVALSWIQGHPARWKTYVANRVAEIQRLMPLARWYHVRSQENPADCASRGISPKQLLSSDLWWNGPSWLTNHSLLVNQPHLSEECSSCAEEELRPPLCLAISAPPKNEFLENFSNFQRLLRFTAWSFRWRKGTETKPKQLHPTELNVARNTWTKIVQAEYFSDELTSLRKQRAVPARSSLIRLTPFLDAHEILRVGGRLEHSTLGYAQRHPAILPSDSPLTSLIIRDAHIQCLHGGVQLTLATLRQNFWVLRGRQIVKTMIRSCVICTRWRAITCKQLMGQLPSARVRGSRPFLEVGVDYAGPFLIKSSRGRGQQARKGYFCVFVCLATRAVHLEAVSDGTTETFLAALKRFVARRGLCRTIFSDCGKNFEGANRELKSLLKNCNYSYSDVLDQTANYGIEWKFNPPAAPHFGGVWEAAVKSVKHHLHRVIGERKLTFEEFTTFLSEVEACLNSRPLQPLSDDPDDLNALTPGHFLIGAPLTAIPEPTYETINVSRLSNWKLLNQMRQQFWNRWSREYLNTLQMRNKWASLERSLQIGDLCLEKDEKLPPTKWPLCRVIRVYPDSAGQVRFVNIKTAKSEFKRPVHKLILLMANSDDSRAAVTSKSESRSYSQPSV